MFFKIQNAFDSHCHFLATGQVASGLSLKNLKSADDVKNLKIEPHHFQGKWLVGFGWDQNQWSSTEFPQASVLDKYFPDFPVFFSRADGHASWINTVAMNQLRENKYDFATDPFGGEIKRRPDGSPTGILLDQAHIHALQKLPEFSDVQIREFLKKSQNIFNRGGFTHVRDLSMTPAVWNHLCELSDKKELTVCVESFITIENISELPKVLAEVHALKKIPNPLLRIQGIKLFLDGSLGSQTAYLSKNYLNKNSKGILCWDLVDVKAVMKAAWQNGFDFAIHTIGDEAVHQAVLTARNLSAEGVLGRLHLEHVQIIRPETLQMMKPLHITCHMQPCHWLSDHHWIKKIISDELVTCSFSWEAIRKNKITLYFGSDAPIEQSSLISNYHALQQSAQLGWPKFTGDWTQIHSHSDKKWTESFTELSDEKILQVHFNGQALL